MSLKDVGASAQPLPLGEIGALTQVGVEELPEMLEYEEDPYSDGDEDILLVLLRQLFMEGHLDQFAFFQLSGALGL